MNILITAFILGIVQSVTEFIPISSTAHLILAKEFFNYNPQIFNLSFDIILHFGSLSALVFFFRRELKEIFISLFKKGRDKKLPFAIILAVIPAIIVGFIFRKYIYALQNESIVNIVIAVTLVVVGILFIFFENIARKNRTLKDVNLRDGMTIGLGQSLALIPGVSRSGITIVTGLFRKFKREDAAKFSFLLSIPTIFLVAMQDIYKLSKTKMPNGLLNVYIVGFIVSAIASFLVIKFFLKYIEKHSLKPFAYYRFILAIVIILLFV